MEVENSQLKNWQSLRELQSKRLLFYMSKQIQMAMAVYLFPSLFLLQLLKKRNPFLDQLLQFENPSLNLRHNRANLSNRSNLLNSRNNSKVGISNHSKAGINLSNHCKMFNQRYARAFFAVDVELVLIHTGDSVQFVELKTQSDNQSQRINSPFEMS